MAARIFLPSGQLARAFVARNALYSSQLASTRYYGGGGELTQEAVSQRVLDVVKQFHKVDAAAVKENSHFTQDLGLDSLDAVELVMAIEDEFAFEVPESEQENLLTVDSVINYVLANPNAK
uniref:Acyl carrier protein n=1 Tax=Paramoeba aestuarina TaxID=180227 RepID=A0A6U2W634_9EUKA|mmetsp:Transcript_13870/g.21575  ORF Transcript_13870/g.21575 Transcript_13870/m.21575 type:complete len:121 (+) Transcript_13870:57-419(+)|eukprot:CAMPEP_0201506908 /NCGR_PEP_ID=MMETSP0161_2-20130828/739_1 /ASSEMBLY_ACC=CAM_ASM_000251 /TAXON_ID=180227 /ORGANISM="Neoparamoeba aestuarina, Strain SoJaBio B1-5/56/2" /LENGTH=120 /DNA_ID=CAMNT_0047901147 /DNA_START=54 /DNA_END=416 /DNA_ORIENTATION=-